MPKPISLIRAHWAGVGFSQRILLIALGGFLVSSLLITLVIYQVMNNQSRQVLLMQQSEISEMVARRIDNALEERKQLLEAFAKQLLSEDRLRPPEAIQQLLDQRNSLHHFYNGGMVVLDETGHSIVDSPLVEGRVGIDFSDRPHVRSARSSAATVITRPLIGRGLKSPVFVVDTPIKTSTGEVIGFLFGVTRLAGYNLFQQIGEEALGQKAKHMVIEPNLKLYITASDPSLAMQPLPDPGHDPVIDRALAGEDSGFFWRSDGNLTLFSSSSLKIMDWRVIHVLPQPDFYASLRIVFIKVALLIALFTLLIGLSSSWLMRRHLQELKRTSEQIKAMALGDQSFQTLPVVRHDEIGQLNSAFNRLHTQLQRHIRALEINNREVSRLSEVMAHHFQEPTRRLVSFAQRLSAHAPLMADEDSRLSLQFIQEQASRLSALTRDAQRYLALNQEPLQNGASADTKEVLQRALRTQQDQQRSIQLTQDADLPRVYLKPHLLEEVFDLLLDNAWRYRRPDRPLQVNISVAIDSARGRAAFRCADNGTGIAPEYRVQVLELFTRLVPNSVSGTGMGLALVRKIVQRSGGQLAIDDGLDGGTAIIFDLPTEISE